MLRVFFTHMHITLGASLATMMRRAGFAVYTPDDEFTRLIRGPYHNSNALHVPGAVQISQEEFKDMPMDIAILMCQEQERANWWPLVGDAKPGMKVVHYAGNEWVPYRRPVDWLLYTNKNVLTHLHARCGAEEFFPILPFSNHLPPLPDRAQLAKPVVRSFINDQNAWPKGRVDFKNLQALGSAQLPGVSIESIAFYSGQTRDEVTKKMMQSLLGVHFKDSEGYGFSVLEAMSMGVPMILPSYLEEKTVGRFVTHEDTGWYVERGVEAIPIIKKCLDDRVYLQAMGDRAAERVRDLINEEDEIETLKKMIVLAAND